MGTYMGIRTLVGGGQADTPAGGGQAAFRRALYYGQRGGREDVLTCR
jgi:hypothetical protein